MALPGDQAPPGVDWISKKLAELERQIKQVAAGRRLEAATIGAGGLDITGGALRVLDASGNLIAELGKTSDGLYGLRVNDTTGVARIRAGQLVDAGYGLEAADASGDSVELAQLAFGQASANVDTGESTTSTATTDLATPGPQVPATIGPSGRCWVTLTADIGWTNNGLNGGEMLFQADGPTPVVLFSGRSLRFTATSIGGVDFQTSRRVLLTGLSPGSYVFSTKYRKAADDGSGSPVFFGSRNITVEPF